MAIVKVSFSGKSTNPDLILEAPHTSRNPHGFGISRDVLTTHEGYDIGSRTAAQLLHKELGGALITSECTRLMVEHNRTVDFHLTGGFNWKHLPHVDTPEKRRAHVDAYHRPYTAAVQNVMDRVLARGGFPIVLNVHTYTDKMNGARRTPFAVVGDEDAVFVQVFRRKLIHRFGDTSRKSLLNKISAITKDDKAKPVALNVPYNLSTLELCQDTRQLIPNDFRKDVMAACYARDIGSPWALVEVRQDIVGEKAIKDILLGAMRETLGDRKMIADHQTRKAEWLAGEAARASVQARAPGQEHRAGM